jgi:SAM-dependent methyltransferase
MHGEAERRNREAGLEGKVTCKLGNALDMPFRAVSFDVVWGQDAWCYVTDKARLVAECARVVRPGGVVAFTDWLETGPMSDERWAALNGFMVFPYLETLDGYVKLAEMAGLQISEREDLSPDFARHIQGYYDALTNGHRAAIVAAYGEDLYEGVKQGLTMWRDASAAGEVGRGRIVARKPS